MAIIDYNGIVVNSSGEYFDWMDGTYKEDLTTVNLTASGWEVLTAIDINGNPIDWDVNL